MFHSKTVASPVFPGQSRFLLPLLVPSGGLSSNVSQSMFNPAPFSSQILRCYQTVLVHLDVSFNKLELIKFYVKINFVVFKIV